MRQKLCIISESWLLTKNWLLNCYFHLKKIQKDLDNSWLSKSDWILAMFDKPWFTLNNMYVNFWSNILFFFRKSKYRISSYSFRGNYSIFNLEIQRSQYIRPKVTVHKGAETIQGRKLFKGGNYMRKYGIRYNTWT